MTADRKEQASKRKIAEGMAEAGEDAIPKGGKKAGKGASGSDEVARGMAKSGSGTATGEGAETTERY
jgi:hypothetical protein